MRRALMFLPFALVGAAVACSSSGDSGASSTTTSTKPTWSWDGGTGGGAGGSAQTFGPADQCDAFFQAWCALVSLSCTGNYESRYGDQFGVTTCMDDARPYLGVSSNDTVCSKVTDLGPSYDTCMWYLTKSGEDVACPTGLDKVDEGSLHKECWDVYAAIHGTTPKECTLQSKDKVPHADTCACVATTCCHSANIFTASENMGPFLECYTTRCQGQEGCPPLG